MGELKVKFERWKAFVNSKKTLEIHTLDSRPLSQF